MAEIGRMSIPVEITPIVDTAGIRRAIAGALADALEELVAELREGEGLDPVEGAELNGKAKSESVEEITPPRRRRRTKAEIDAAKAAQAASQSDVVGSTTPGPTVPPVTSPEPITPEQPSTPQPEPAAPADEEEWTPAWA